MPSTTDREYDAYADDVPYDDTEAYDIDEEAQDAEAAAGEATGDEAVAGAMARVGSSAKNAAVGAGRSIAGGVSALRQVRHASKLRSDAEADVREIERGLEEDRDELAHRDDVERNYTQIVAAQSAEIADAQAAVTDAETSIAEHRSQAQQLTNELRAMRERHEQKLRPYRNLMDSSRGRSDDAAKALANVRRNVRSAERALADATKNRDTRISGAHRSVDAAQERVGALETELAALMQGEDEAGTSEAAIAKMEGELASNRAALASARTDVTQITQEAQDAVDQAQRRLLSLQRDQTQAEKLAETAKAEATARKDEYDGMYRDAQAKEKAHEEAIKSCETRIRDLTQSRDAAQDRLDDARDMLDEANEIHAHPETTEGLRQRIADEEADLADAQEELDELLQEERELRRSTRGSRIIAVAVGVLVLVLIALCVWFFVLRK